MPAPGKTDYARMRMKPNEIKQTLGKTDIFPETGKKRSLLGPGLPGLQTGARQEEQTPGFTADQPGTEAAHGYGILITTLLPT